MSNKEQGLAWNKSYNIGYEKVDEQHQKLFALINELSSSCNDETDTVTLKDTLDFLVDYAVQHFYDEESVQVQYNFPLYRQHKALHEEFKLSVGELVLQFSETGSTEELSSNVNKIMARWIIQHVLKEDKKIGMHIKMCTERTDFKIT